MLPGAVLQEPQHFHNTEVRRERDEPADPLVMNCGASRKQAIDEAIVNMIIIDCQPLSLVEDKVTADAIVEVQRYISEETTRSTSILENAKS